MNIQRLMFLAITMLSLYILSACGSSTGSSTPEQAVRRSEARLLQNLQLLGTYNSGGRTVVLYTGVRNDTTSGFQDDVLGYTFVSLTNTGWRAENSGSMSPGGPPDAQTLISYSVLTTQTNNDLRIIVYGRALNPPIHSVEVTFSTGVTEQSRVENGAFAVISSGADKACLIRALDDTSKEVQLPANNNVPSAPGC